tara:strand:+ start:693 stop:821 length:129 start_codon:yes stop_codon:yes gene_type:complete
MFIFAIYFSRIEQQEREKENEKNKTTKNSKPDWKRQSVIQTG